MSRLTHLKRLVYLTHRWTGIFGCLLMALWFISGITMLFVGYPKLTPWERLGALPPLSHETCCLSQPAPWQVGTTLSLTTIAGQARYLRSSSATGEIEVLDAATLALAPPTTQTLTTSARQFIPNAQVQDEGKIWEDRWTHARALDAHRPLHVMQMNDAAHTRLYLSSLTGQVLLDAPASQRGWNYVGAWLHWLYMFRFTSTDLRWHWLVVGLSLLCTISALTGILAGLWRWRFAGHYKSGSRSPYREAWMYWHHVLGLLFSALLLAWILSGLASMNPLGIFSLRHATHVQPPLPNQTSPSPALLDSAVLIRKLHQQGFYANELEWKSLHAQTYVVAHNALNDTRVLFENQGEITIHSAVPDSLIHLAVQAIRPGDIVSSLKLTQADAYYYARQPEAMNGAAIRSLPVWRFIFADVDQTWIYIAAKTGEIALVLDSHRRAGRWWFNLLHSWDLPAMLRWPLSRTAMLILLSLGGLAICLTGALLGWRRLRLTLRR